jgi:hypothetical protein
MTRSRPSHGAAVTSARRASPTRVAAVAVALVGAVLIGRVWGHVEVSRAQDAPTVSPSATGDELANSLGLQPVTSYPVVGCEYFVESTDGLGYCLDPVVDDPAQAWELAERVRGNVPTDSDRQAYQLLQELINAEDESVQARLAARVAALLADD